jgi:hypothetical protein
VAVLGVMSGVGPDDSIGGNVSATVDDRFRGDVELAPSCASERLGTELKPFVGVMVGNRNRFAGRRRLLCQRLQPAFRGG